MSELKVYGFCSISDFLYQGTDRGQLSNEMLPYYLKSEADKVIAEKDKENRKLKRALWLARAERNRALAAIVHCQGAWHDTLDTKQS